MNWQAIVIAIAPVALLGILFIQMLQFKSVVDSTEKVLTFMERHFVPQKEFAEYKLSQEQALMKTLDKLYEDMERRDKHVRDNANTAAASADQLIIGQLHQVKTAIDGSLALFQQQVDTLTKAFEKLESNMKGK